MTNILFVHNNFPAQFLHVARTLARTPGVKLTAIGSHTARATPGVKLLKYAMGDGDVAATHPFARRFDLECRRAEQVLYAASGLASMGLTPDVILGHPGWGELLPLRAMFPKSRIVTYCEFFYRSDGQDVGFDPEFPPTGIDGHVRISLKNAATLLALENCDAAISPTPWQRSNFPEHYQSKIQVIHEGVDVNRVKPSADAQFRLPSGETLSKDDEIVTFATRSFEPLRGFHIFMRALPRILAARPRARVLVIGGAGRPYGGDAPEGRNWKSIFFDEVADQVDQTRIHFTGTLGHDEFVRALQVSRAHVYLTYPFVLSWSLLEAMSAGCLVITSDTAPLRDIIDGSNGILTPFFDVDGLARHVVEALAHPARSRSMRKRARDTIVQKLDMKRICVPKMLEVLGLATSGHDRHETRPVAQYPESRERVKVRRAAM